MGAVGRWHVIGGGGAEPKNGRGARTQKVGTEAVPTFAREGRLPGAEAPVYPLASPVYPFVSPGYPLTFTNCSMKSTSVFTLSTVTAL